VYTSTDWTRSSPLPSVKRGANDRCEALRHRFSDFGFGSFDHYP
jgi:hypothetical protein